VILGLCVAIGFGAGIVRRRLDPTLQSEREREIRQRLAGPSMFLSAPEAERLKQELRRMDERASAVDLLSGLRTAALVALVWCIVRAKPRGGVGLAVALGAVVGGAPIGSGLGREASLALLAASGALFGAGIGALTWYVAEHELDAEITE